MYFGNYGLPKTWLDKYQKGNDLEFPWTSNMFNRLKNILSLKGGTFIIFIDHCEGN